MKTRPSVVFMFCMSMLVACSSELDKVEEMRTVKTATGEVSVPVNQNASCDWQVLMEKVLELEPDLIITFNQEAVTDYEKIALTVLFNVSNYNSMEERVTEMGESLNRQKEAKAFLNDMKNRVETMRKKVLQAVPTDATITIINSKDDKNATLEIEDGGGEALYNLLGLSMPENLQKLLQDKDETRLTMS